jgi:hypothetical protein
VWTDIGPSLSNCINGALPSKAPFDTALAIYFARISDGDKKKIFNILNDPNFFYVHGMFRLGYRRGLPNLALAIQGSGFEVC